MPLALEQKQEGIIVGLVLIKILQCIFCTWVSPEFYLKLIQEFQRLKQAELEQQNRLEEWQQNRWLTKINYTLHADAIKDNIMPILNTPKNMKVMFMRMKRRCWIK